MLGDLNIILDGLTELEDQGVETIDCRRAQFSAQEPIIRLRMICQSWKVMFQAEYSSGQPLRMLVDLRASVDDALGRGKTSEPKTKAEAKPKVAATKPSVRAGATRPASVAGKALAAKAGAGASASKPASRTVSAPVAAARKKPEPVAPQSNAPEFEISSTPGWDPDPESQTGKKH
jgi:hypothetical protein